MEPVTGKFHAADISGESKLRDFEKQSPNEFWVEMETKLEETRPCPCLHFRHVEAIHAVDEHAVPLTWATGLKPPNVDREATVTLLEAVIGLFTDTRELGRCNPE